MPKRPSQQAFLYNFYVALFDVEPLVWRRFTVPGNITFEQFHEVIQVVMGWEQSHMYVFRFGPFEVSFPDEEFFKIDNAHLDAQKTVLDVLGLEHDDLLTYIYDFGDNWVHMLRLEFFSDVERGEKSIRCEDGAGACPPEDVGGPFGYDLHLKALADETDPNHADAIALSRDFDSAGFDVNRVNEQLSFLTAKFKNPKSRH